MLLNFIPGKKIWLTDDFDELLREVQERLAIISGDDSDEETFIEDTNTIPIVDYTDEDD